MTLALRTAQIDALVQLRQTRPDLRVVMIGATALLHHLAIERYTADIDLVLVAELDELAPLLGPLGWRRDQRQLQRWMWRDGVMADILPISISIVASGKIVFEPGVEMSLVGFEILLAHAEAVRLPGTQIDLEVATLPVIAVMKMVAWLERPNRVKDLSDISRIFTSSLASTDTRRFDPETVLFNVEFDEQPAFFIGAEVRRIASAQHLEVMRRFIAKLRDPNNAAFLQMLKVSPLLGDDKEDRLWRMIEAFERGLGT